MYSYFSIILVNNMVNVNRIWAVLGLTNETKKLHRPLVKWIALPRHDWIWFYSMKDKIIYRKGPTQWISYVMGRSASCSSTIYYQNNNVTIARTCLSLTTVIIIIDKIINFERKDYTDINDIPQTMAPKCN